MRSAVILALLFCASCGNPAPERAERRERIRRQREQYTPPADGRLSEKQIRSYIAVQRESVGSPRSAAPDGDEPLPPGELAAVNRLRLNIEEYLWVRQKLLETEIAADERDVR